MTAPLLSVQDLRIDFRTPHGPVRVVDGVSFDVHADEVFGIVGESGSGKSVTMLAVMGLLPRAARVVGGRILLRGRDITDLPEDSLRRLRGKELAMVFQDPLTSLNPVITVGHQLAEAVQLHNPGLDRRAVRARVVELLDGVRVPNAAARASSYPHEFSGGMRQRVMIAMAVANHPAVLIADEPTTALDVTIQAQVLELLREVRVQERSAMVLITHDLGVVAESADRVLVMYSGRAVETASVGETFHDPRHPYTAGLMASMLRVDGDRIAEAYSVPGQPPDPADRPTGCTFHPRCTLASLPLCATEDPAPREVGRQRYAACHRADLVPGWIRQELP